MALFVTCYLLQRWHGERHKIASCSDPFSNCLSTYRQLLSSSPPGISCMAAGLWPESLSPLLRHVCSLTCKIVFKLMIFAYVYFSTLQGVAKVIHNLRQYSNRMRSFEAGSQAMQQEQSHTFQREQHGSGSQSRLHCQKTSSRVASALSEC